ncbi:hypothetical protein ACFV9C_06910 [Kribbella sp. NPDC059898]|uniref:hypothetical protein n=1 Tax=Kribbella sp. NPDC059898 TaxID=3346995 RepID=UPI00365B83FD
MAGTIELTSGIRWSVPSWAFEAVVEYLIDELAGDPAVETLKEVAENNLGWVGIDQFEDVQRVRILTLLRDGLMQHVEQRDPAGATGRIRELSELAGLTLARMYKG